MYNLTRQKEEFKKFAAQTLILKITDSRLDKLIKMEYLDSVGIKNENLGTKNNKC